MDPEQALQQQKQECIFCHIIAGDVASRKIYEDDKFVALLDINPANPGHLLVLTKEHYSVMPQVPDEELAHLSFVIKSLSNACLKSLGARGTTIFEANGVAAGQRASHFMVHIIPRQPNDNVGMILPEHQLPEHQFNQIKFKIAKVIAEVFGTKVPSEIESESKAELEKPEAPKHSADQKHSASNETKEAEKHETKEETKSSQGTPALDEIAEFLAKNKLGLN